MSFLHLSRQRRPIDPSDFRLNMQWTPNGGCSHCLMTDIPVLRLENMSDGNATLFRGCANCFLDLMQAPAAKPDLSPMLAGTLDAARDALVSPRSAQEIDALVQAIDNTLAQTGFKKLVITNTIKKGS